MPVNSPLSFTYEMKSLNFWKWRSRKSFNGALWRRLGKWQRSFSQLSGVMSSVLCMKCCYVSVGGTIKLYLSKAGFITMTQCVAGRDKNFTLLLARYMAIGMPSLTLYR